ncbi:MAG: hypothetical protein S4CHLAM7_07890 [Chlamydiae bacterium]|nr:hypothetical protein [Chlamydiota bacterium]
MKKINKSHENRAKNFQIVVNKFKNKFIAQDDDQSISAQEKIDILDKVCDFPLGRHIVLTGGANAFWTDYMIAYPWSKKRQAPRRLLLHRLEHYILFECLSVLSQRELFLHAQSIAQTFVKNKATLASIPCGLMRDLFTLDFSNIDQINLVGIDIDNAAIEFAENKYEKKKGVNLELLNRDAWNLQINERFDFINSIGLNVYEKDRTKVVELYKQFHLALKDKGVLFTGVLTYPPWSKQKSDWNLQYLDSVDLQMEKILSEDILDINFRNYRTIQEIKEDFLGAGFSEVEIILDKHSVFPSVIAYK